ncbi:XrtA-associated tyrosine autokinase [Photobacterium sp. GSS17]|uniref:XrtA-associated tyrosine autokinase n=1 Tax=Photobacterium sp. GSS17 TaxID=3020715 RepID=UPI002361A4F5|nr:XrtA-associated tyrosine autokinase [Photobacterium sp. GSS17]
MSIIQKALKKGGGKKPGKQGMIARAMDKSKEREQSPSSNLLASGSRLSNTSMPERSMADVDSHTGYSQSAAGQESVLAFTGEAELYIDTERLKKMGMVSHTDEQANSQITNEFRSIKHKLLYNAFGPASETLKSPNMVMVSSPNPMEGKTFTSVNLALSISSEKDKTILLIDADVLKPSVSKTLGLDEKPGLIEYLLGEVSDISEVIYTTNIPNLRLLPAGRPHHLSNELLASDKMEKLTRELSARYVDRILLFDCPPLLYAVETTTIAKFMGQAMIVVEQSKTRMSDIEQAISELNREMVIGFILNKATRGINSRYGYGYGYGLQTNSD